MACACRSPSVWSKGDVFKKSPGKTALTATNEVQSLTSVDLEATTEKDEVCALGSHTQWRGLKESSQPKHWLGHRGQGVVGREVYGLRGRRECRECAIIWKLLWPAHFFSQHAILEEVTSHDYVHWLCMARKDQCESIWCLILSLVLHLSALDVCLFVGWTWHCIRRFFDAAAKFWPKDGGRTSIGRLILKWNQWELWPKSLQRVSSNIQLHILELRLVHTETAWARQDPYQSQNVLMRFSAQPTQRPKTQGFNSKHSCLRWPRERKSLRCYGCLDWKPWCGNDTCVSKWHFSTQVH